MWEQYVLAKTFGAAIYDVDNVTVEFFLAIMREEAKADREAAAKARSR